MSTQKNKKIFQVGTEILSILHIYVLHYIYLYTHICLCVYIYIRIMNINICLLFSSYPPDNNKTLLFKRNQRL